jgi:hypothetical protein
VGPTVILTVQTSAPKPHRRHPNCGRCRFAMPTASPPPPRCPQSRRRAALASNGYKRSTPGEQLFSSSAPSPPLRRRAAIIEPPQTATSVPLRTPLTSPRAPHRCRELPQPLCRRPRLLLCSTTVAPRRSVCAAVEPPAPVNPFLPKPPKSVPRVTSYL